MMRGSILRRFTLLSVLIASVVLIPMVVFGLYAIQVVSDRLTRETVERLQRGARDDAEKLQRSFDMVQGDLPLLSQLPPMRELVRARVGGNPREIALALTPVEQAFLTFSRNRQLYSRIRYLDEDGQEVVRVEYDGTQPPRLVPVERVQEKGQRDSFAETMKLQPGQIYASPLDLNRERGQIEVPHRPVIRYATPLFDDAGTRRGILIINLMVGPLLEALYQEAKAARKVVYAVDQEGFYLLHPDPRKQWGGPRDLNTGERIQRDLPTLADRLLSRHAVATVVGGQVITAQPLALGQGRAAPFLAIVELMPTGVVLASVADFRLYLVVVLVWVGVVALLGAALTGERLARPIEALAWAARQVQQGDLDARVQVGGPHEITVLGQAFNAMTEALAQARGQIERQLRELTAINRIGTAVSGTLSLNEVLDQALDATLLALGVDAGEIFLLDEEQGEVVLARHRGLALEAFREISRFKLGEGFPGRVALSGEPLVTTDLANDLRFLRKQVIEAGFSTFASIPLKAAGKVIGTLDVASRTPCAFTEGDLPLLTTIGATIGMAVANARLYETQRVTALQLEAKVEDRTRDLQATNVQLQETTRQAEVASRHKSDFLANMSHELRTPLNSILGFAELLQDPTFGPLTEKQARYLGHIHTSGKHLLTLINDLLDLSKVEAGKLDLRPEAFVLHEALTAALTEFQLQADAKRLELELHVDESLSMITADPTRFKQIVYNLLSNAVKFTPEGGRITVSAKLVRGAACAPPTHPSPSEGGGAGRGCEVRGADSSDWVEIAVADTGIGIKAEDLPRLFQSFTQLESPVIKRYQGTGLGLALTRRLVELHGGQILAESEGEGKGSRFTVLLPRAGLRGIPRLLLVEDDEALAATLRNGLQAAGYQVELVRDGATALAQIPAIRPDLIILDLRLPVVDGWEVLRQLRADPSTRFLPILTITGVYVKRAEEALAAGANEFLTKPFSLAVLESTIGRLLRGGWRRVGRSGARRSGNRLTRM